MRNVSRLLGFLGLALLLSGCGHSSSSEHSAWVVFTSDRDGRWDVYAVHPDGTGLIRVTDRRRAMAPHLAASPDGTWLAIVAGDRSIVFDEQGGRHLRPGGDAYATPLVDDHGKVSQMPADGRFRSPDGKYVAIANERGEFTVVAKRRATPKVLAHGATDPSWSPDGRWISFDVPDGGPKYDPILDLAVARPDGSALRNVTRSTEGESAYDASWSSDGRRLVFARGHSPHVGRFDLDQIWISDRDGSNARALTRAYPTGGNNDEPVWFDGTLHGVPGLVLASARREEGRATLRTRYLVGELRARGGHVALLPMAHSPQVPQPSAPLVFWTVATGTTVSRAISSCSAPEGLQFDGQRAVFDCNNSCCDSTDESLRVYALDRAAPVDAAEAHGGWPTRRFLSGYGLDDGVLVYAVARERRNRLLGLRLWRFENGRRSALAGPAGTVLAAGGGRVVLARDDRLDVVDLRGALLYQLPLKIDSNVLVGGFSAQPPDGPQVRLDRSTLLTLDDGLLRRWNAKTGGRQRAWPAPRNARLEALSQGRALLVAGRTVHVVRLADGHDTALTFPAAAHIDPVKAGSYYNEYVLNADLDGRTLVVAYNVGLVKEPGRVVVVHVA